jgi:hypothetical protein
MNTFAGMNAEAMTRKQFVKLTFTLLGGAAAVAACGSNTYGGGSNGSSGTGGSTATVACQDPLPETQLPDSTGHTHTVTIPASDLEAAADQTINTSVTGGHMHAITLAVADLATLKGGGQVTATSTSAGTPSHTHMYSVSCQAT